MPEPYGMRSVIINMNARIKYALLWAASIPIGLLSRKYRHLMPDLLDEYLGDVIWAMMLYYGARMLFTKRHMHFAFFLSIIFAYSVELSGLIKVGWLSAIRHTFLGHMVLGTDFTPSDFVCYTIGIIMAYLSDRIYTSVKQKTQAKAKT